jgi:hypothetical protein
MSMNGGTDPVYVAARGVLLTALVALAEQRDSIVVVGAHAIYLHVSEADLQVAPFTTDADLAFDPARLHDQPLIEQCMHAAGFVLGAQPGQWIGPGGIEVDLMVPEAVSGAGRRRAEIPPHGDRVARSARGLEAAIVDCQVRSIASLDPQDPRDFDVRVAGPGALLVSKLVKLGERIIERPNRVDDKDALDVFRLLRTPTDALAGTLRDLLGDATAAGTTREALEHLERHFCTRAGTGVALVARALGGVQAGADTEVQVSALARRLLERIRRI